MITPIFFAGVNITKDQCAEGVGNHTLLRFGRGIYIDNVFKLYQYQHLELQEKLKVINDTIASYSPWIASYITPNATLIASSAYFGQINRNGKLFIDGVTSGRTTHLGKDFLTENAKQIGDEIIERMHNVDLSLTVERLRTREAVKSEDCTTINIPDYLLHNSGMLRYQSSIDSLNNLQQLVASVTLPHRTLIDICRWQYDDERSLNDLDFIDLCSSAGVSFIASNEHEDKTILAKLCNSPSATVSVKLELIRRFDLLLNPLVNRSKDLEDALIMARIQYKISHPQNVFEIYHYDRKVANLIDTGGHEWAIRGEGWLMPLEPTDTRMPPVISNLMPEVVKITPPEYLNFFRQSSRFMSNIQIVELGKGKSHNDYHEILLDVDQDLFEGKVKDIPTFSANFDFDNTKLALDVGIPRVSGLQIKLPMHLSKENNQHVLTLAKDKPFTHMLKLASNSQQSLVIGEWFGMHIAKSIGANTAKFQLVDLSNEHGKRLGYITERFDIALKNSPEEYLACDLCSIMGWPAESKYKCSMEVAIEIIKLNTSDFEKEKYSLLAMIVAGLLSDNTDLHLKNISLIKDESKRGGYTLAPVYDMVVTSVLPTFSHSKIALTINDTYEPTLSDIVTFAQKSLGIEPQNTRNYLEMACEQVKSLSKNLSDSFKFSDVPEYAHALERCVQAVDRRIFLFQPSLESERVKKIEADATSSMSIEELIDLQQRKNAVHEVEIDDKHSRLSF